MKNRIIELIKNNKVDQLKGLLEDNKYNYLLIKMDGVWEVVYHDDFMDIITEDLPSWCQDLLTNINDDEIMDAYVDNWDSNIDEYYYLYDLVKTYNNDDNLLKGLIMELGGHQSDYMNFGDAQTIEELFNKAYK